ncbi:AMP-binding protein [Ruicaihuangia caeni]|uniref:AMP-binding protein n=1 Tax=Ruicaihuangia caeni TaxID=3042517 RepID=A0AAW6T848_9MICO|nr:AMP-binding protein [Klugiella sp. YN-L-19]MDI2098479.1 AMP-binding protein [Klugiella sp. YN-L-19]
MLRTPPSFPFLGGGPRDVALIEGGREVLYEELACRVAERAERLGDTRRLVMITAGNAVEPIVTYLAALAGRHPVMFVADDEAGRRSRETFVELFNPDVVAAGRDESWALCERRRGTSHELHPELAMLVGTSGSTGSAKLVRLSHENLRSNAAAIAQYLNLTRDDRGVTTLPLQYCYGLSVVNSHLTAGASVALTDRSVSDEQFWRDFAAVGATSFAGVPYTFELLEASRFEERSLPSLRYITQAGGRLAPELVRRYARLGKDRGFELFVMYGQTEATARMAYLEPGLAETKAGAIGGPIPGGSLRVDLEAGTDVGELVYSGPNVMLGYAHSAADFALGRTVHELRTGDLARHRRDGLFEVVGRMNRFAKVFGLRIDLDELEQRLAADGFDVRLASANERLLVFALAERHVAGARHRAAAVIGVPLHAVEGFAVAEFPRTASGKPDTAALVRFAERTRAPHGMADRSAPNPQRFSGDAASTAASITALYLELLGRPDATPNDSFASLGGDSLSYVEVSLRLEPILGKLPRDWPSMTPIELAQGGTPPSELLPGTVNELDGCDDWNASTASRAPRLAPGAGAPDRKHATDRSRWSGTQRVDTAAVLRALAIVLIVGSHADLFRLQGGAHVLLAVVGYNLARFQLADVPGAGRTIKLLRSVAQLAAPAVLWIGSVALITGEYRATTALLVNAFVPGPDRWTDQWQFWFFELAVWIMLGLAALFAARPLDQLDRRLPFAFPLALVVGALVARYAVTGVESGLVERYTVAAALWIFAIGWAGARARRLEQRVLLSLITVAGTLGFFADPAREAVVIAGVLVLLWLPTLRLPRILVPATWALAGASMFIYLTHWQVFPVWESTAPVVGTVLSLAVGVAAWRGYRALEPLALKALAKVPLAGRSTTPERVTREAIHG